MTTTASPPAVIRVHANRDFLTDKFVPDFRALLLACNGGPQMGAKDIVLELRAPDGCWIWLPLKLEGHLSEKPHSTFWKLYPRSISHKGKVFSFVGTHQADRMVYYRCQDV